MANEQCADATTEPATLWHYTTVAALIKIVEKDRIWATRADFLNDSGEVNFGKYLATRYGKSKLPDEGCCDGFDLPEFDWLQYLSTFDSTDRKAVYIASFTTEGNSESQWLTYGDRGRGVAIGFDYRKLRKRLLRWNNAVPRGYDIFMPVCYCDESDTNAAGRYFEKLRMSVSSNSQDDGHASKLAALSGSLLLKDKNIWSQEREWRIIAPINGQNEEDFDKLIRLPSVGDIPCAKAEKIHLYLPWEYKSKPALPIDYIRLGPSFDNQETKDIEGALRCFLDQNKHNACSIERCSSLDKVM